MRLRDTPSGRVWEIDATVPTKLSQNEKLFDWLCGYTDGITTLRKQKIFADDVFYDIVVDWYKDFDIQVTIDSEAKTSPRHAVELNNKGGKGHVVYTLQKEQGKAAKDVVENCTKSRPRRGRRAYIAAMNAEYNEEFIVTIDNGSGDLKRVKFDGKERFIVSVYAKSAKMPRNSGSKGAVITGKVKSVKKVGNTTWRYLKAIWVKEDDQHNYPPNHEA